MKKFMALAVALSMAVCCVSCGDSDDDNTTSKTSASSTSSSASEENAGGGGTDVEDALTEETVDSGDYEIICLDEYMVEDLSDEEMNEVASKAVNQMLDMINASISGDDEACKEAANIEFLNEWGEGEILEEAIENLTEGFSTYGISDTSYTIEDVTHVVITGGDVDSDDSGNKAIGFEAAFFADGLMFGGFYMEINGDHGAVAYAVKAYDSYEAWYSETYGAYEEKVDLKTANSNAKLAYNTAIAAMQDLETQGTLDEEVEDIGGSYGIASLENSSNKVLKTLYSTFSDNGSLSGYVYIAINGYGTVEFIQWKESDDSDIIGQYPNPSSDTDNMPTWGIEYLG